MFWRLFRHTGIRRRGLLCGAVLSLLSAGCYDDAGTPATTIETPPETTTLAELRRLYAGRTVRIESDIFVRGRVVTSDRAGNFYRTLVLEEEGAAAELMAGIDGLHNVYPEGCELTVGLRELALGESYGVLQIGRLPEAGSGYATDYLGSRAALDAHVFRGDTYSPLRPAVCTIGELTPDMAGRLVRIDGLRYAPETVEEATWAGYKRFTDADGNTIRTYTRAYADFADRAIPECEVLLVGILQYTSGADDAPRYLLKLRDETDCWY